MLKGSSTSACDFLMICGEGSGGDAVSSLAENAREESGWGAERERWEAWSGIVGSAIR